MYLSKNRYRANFLHVLQGHTSGVFQVPTRLGGQKPLLPVIPAVKRSFLLKGLFCWNTSFFSPELGKIYNGKEKFQAVMTLFNIIFGKNIIAKKLINSIFYVEQCQLP